MGRNVIIYMFMQKKHQVTERAFLFRETLLVLSLKFAWYDFPCSLCGWCSEGNSQVLLQLLALPWEEWINSLPLKPPIPVSTFPSQRCMYNVPPTKLMAYFGYQLFFLHILCHIYVPYSIAIKIDSHKQTLTCIKQLH